MFVRRWHLACAAMSLAVCTSSVLAGPKGTISVPRRSSPVVVDGNFADWNLASYTTVARQPVFPDGQGVGVPTNANGDHLVWEKDRIGPFNGTDLSIYEPESPSEFGSSIYFQYDDKFLYVLGVFVDDQTNGVRGPGGLDNYLNDGFEFFIDAKGDSNDLIAELGFPTIDPEAPNTDDFQFTFGLNDAFEPSPKSPSDLGAEVHMERAGDPNIVKQAYLDIRSATNFSSVGGRDVAARKYDNLKAAGALNPEVLANPNTPITGYAVELVVPFNITEGFKPDHDMGFDLFWRDVDDDTAGDPGFGGANIFWTDWGQATTVAGLVEDGNLFHAGNWGKLHFITGNPNDLDGNGSLGVGDIDALASAIRSGKNEAKFDITKNGQVNFDDLVSLVTDVDKLKTFFGDANLDGEFNSSDFVVVFGVGEYEDGVAGNSTWAEGDWNSDAEFDSSDFVTAFAAGSYEQGPRAAIASVPEPSALALSGLGILSLASFVRRTKIMRIRG